MCVSVAACGSRPVRSSSNHQEEGQDRVVSVERRSSSVDRSSVPRSRRRGRRAPTAVAGMAPALTQATPHQRSCCAPNHSVTLAQPSNHKHQHHLPTTVEDKQSVWPASSSHCCGGGGGGVNGSSSNGGGNGAVKPVAQRSRNVKNSNNSSSSVRAKTNGNSNSCSNKKEIARSEETEAAKSRTGGGGGADVQQSQNSSQQQRILSSAPTSTDSGVISSKAAVAPRSSPNGGGVAVPLNGTKTTMGLQPATAPGDRMVLDSSPPPISTDVPISTTTPTTTPGIKKTPIVDCWTSTAEQAEHSITGMTECPDVEEATVDELLDVFQSIEAAEMHGLLRDAFKEESSNTKLPPSSSSPLRNLSPVSVVDKEAEVERRLSEATTKQHQIEQRCQTLLRRAGRLQSRHVSRHVADQVANFVVYARETLSLGSSNGGRGSHSGAGGTNLYGWAEDGRLPTREEVRNIPTATLVNLVSRLQAPPVSYLSNRRYFGVPSRSSTSQQHPLHLQQQQQQQRPGQKLTTSVAETLEEVAGLWEAQLRYLQRHDDPDATESSSGGESDDDMPVAPQAPITPYTTSGVTTAPSSSSAAVATDQQQQQLSSELVLPITVEAPTIKPVPT